MGKKGNRNSRGTYKDAGVSSAEYTSMNVECIDRCSKEGKATRHRVGCVRPMRKTGRLYGQLDLQHSVEVAVEPIAGQSRSEICMSDTLA